MARHKRRPDPETAAVLAELAEVARGYAAAGDESSVRQMGYVLTTMESIRCYGYDGLERIRASRYLREAAKRGVTGGQVNGRAAGS